MSEKLITKQELKTLAEDNVSKVLPNEIIKQLNVMLEQHMYSDWFWMHFGNDSNCIPYEYEAVVEHHLKTAGYDVSAKIYSGKKVCGIRVEI